MYNLVKKYIDAIPGSFTTEEFSILNDFMIKKVGYYYWSMRECKEYVKFIDYIRGKL